MGATQKFYEKDFNGWNMNLKQATQHIINEVNIVQFLEGEGFSPKKLGSIYRIQCPFHDDSTPSVSISTEKNVWHCFGCQKGGSLITFIELLQGVSRLKAVQYILEKLGIQLEINTVDNSILVTAMNYFIQQEFSDTATRFFENKNLTKEIIIEFGLGYSSNKENLFSHLTSSGFTSEQIFMYDLVGEKFDNSIIYPIYDYVGNIISLKARMLDGGTKYIGLNQNIPTAPSIMLNGLHTISGDTVYLVEGDNDRIALKQYLSKSESAVSMMGLNFDIDRYKLLKSFGIKDFIFWVDGDGAGFDFIYRLSNNFISIFGNDNVSVKCIFIPNFDPDSFVKGGGNKYVEYIKPITQIFVENLSGDLKMMIDTTASAFRGCSIIIREELLGFLSKKLDMDILILREIYEEVVNQDIYDILKERYIISYLVKHQTKIFDVEIKSEWFSKKIHQQIIDGLLGNYEISTDSTIQKYISELPIIEVSLFDIIDNLVVIRNLHNKRKLINVSKRIIQIGENSIEEAVNFVDNELNSLILTDAHDAVNIGESMKNIIDTMISGHITFGHSFGANWTITNQILLGLLPKLIMILGNTGHGKTNIALNWVNLFSMQQNIRGLYFSGEMSEDELTKRLISIATGIPSIQILTNQLTAGDIQKVIQVSAKIDSNVFHMSQEMNIQNALSLIKYHKRRYGIQYVVFDYIQLMSLSGREYQNMSRTSQLKEITRLVKDKVVEKLGIPAIILGQLGDDALDEPIPTIRRSSESKLMTADADIGIAMRRKSDKEKSLDPRGDILFHIDKVRYNTDKQLLLLNFNRTNLFINEVGMHGD